MKKLLLLCLFFNTSYAAASLVNVFPNNVNVKLVSDLETYDGLIIKYDRHDKKKRCGIIVKDEYKYKRLRANPNREVLVSDVRTLKYYKVPHSLRIAKSGFGEPFRKYTGIFFTDSQAVSHIICTPRVKSLDQIKDIFLNLLEFSFTDYLYEADF